MTRLERFMRENPSGKIVDSSSMHSDPQRIEFVNVQLIEPDGTTWYHIFWDSAERFKETGLLNRLFIALGIIEAADFLNKQSKVI